jgi:hypothetical protein
VIRPPWLFGGASAPPGQRGDAGLGNELPTKVQNRQFELNVDINNQACKDAGVRKSQKRPK